MRRALMKSAPSEHGRGDIESQPGAGLKVQTPATASIEPTKQTEEAFCDRLRAWAESLGFVVYPEVKGWDLILVPGAEAVSVNRSSWKLNDADIHFDIGDQVGVHAKLRPSFEVLHQAMGSVGAGPKFALVAVPRAVGGSFCAIARRLGIGVITEEDDKINIVSACSPQGRAPLKLPPFASRSIRAGTPSPSSLSVWRLKALRWLAWARQQPDGELTALDLERFGLHRTWADSWMIRAGFVYRDMPKGGVRKVQAYRIKADATALPDFGYEGVAVELAAHDANATTEARQ